METKLRRNVDGHFDMLLTAMLFISLLIAAVDFTKLASAMGTGVADRSSGARPGTMLRNVPGEGVWIAR